MDKMFYLRDSRSDVGRTCMFWADRGGYTSNLDLAEVFTLEEAQRQFNSRHTDVPLCKELVDELATAHVDCQYLGDSGRKTGCDEYVIRVGARTDGNDVYWASQFGFSDINYNKATIFSYQDSLDIQSLRCIGIKITIYAKPDIDAIARRTFQAANINERRMITAAGIRKPKRPRTRRTTGKARGNCPHCGCITWGLNPYENYTCAESDAERRGFSLWGSCKEVKKSKQDYKKTSVDVGIE